jgi:hypothetical protein
MLVRKPFDRRNRSNIFARGISASSSNLSRRRGSRAHRTSARPCASQPAPGAIAQQLADDARPRRGIESPQGKVVPCVGCVRLTSRNARRARRACRRGSVVQRGSSSTRHAAGPTPHVSPTRCLALRPFRTQRRHYLFRVFSSKLPKDLVWEPTSLPQAVGDL